MAQNIKSILQNTQDLQMSNSAINALVDFERVLDELGLYAYAHWKLGELVAGPEIEKYYVTCSFMWPKKLMPDPSGAERLLNYDCKITYRTDVLKYPRQVKTYDDFEPGTKFPKLDKKPVWIVKIRIPRKLMNTIEVGSLELEGETMDLTDLDTAYDENLDEKQVQSDGTDIAPGAAPGAAPAPAPPGL
jgi:hypothetical protein